VSGDWLVAVTAGRWQINGIRKAKSLGLKVVAIDADPGAAGFAEADHVLNMRLDELDKVLKALTEMRVHLRGAVSFASDAGVPLAAAIRKYFDLPGTRPDICSRLVNKAIQRSLWARHRVPGPRVQLVESQQTAVAAIANFGFPLIIKPADSSGSRGVTLLESANDDIVDAVERAFRFSRSSQVLLESYMRGTEFTVETFSVRGTHHVLAVTEKKKVEGTRGTVARELATPQRSSEVLGSISDAAVRAYTALGYEDGPGHAEVILMQDGSVGLVEVAGRGGGFQVFDRFVPAVSGVDIGLCTVMQAVGLDVGPLQLRHHAAVLRFIPSRPGTLVAISGLDEANALEGVEAGAIASIGDTFGHAAADGDRLGWILSKGGTPTIAQQRADQAEQLISFEVNP
jgi:biotin carboxylase